jgi:hypothetical protein
VGVVVGCDMGSEEEGEGIGCLLCLHSLCFLDAFNCQSSIQGTTESNTT